jgi:hypothetical protein
MTRHPRFECTHPRHLAGLLVGLVLAVGGQAAAAPSFVDGTPVEGEAICILSGNTVTGVVSRAGYVVDPVAELPQLGQVTYIHAVATNKNSCEPGGETVGFEFFLPPGASLAVSAANPVKCFIGNGSTSGPAPNCLQVPVPGNTGGAFFGFQSGLAVNWSFEIHVPVIFNQPIVGAPLRVSTASDWGTEDSFVAVTAPYQPTPLPGTRGDDLTLVGGSLADATLPVAFSNDNGSFTVTSYPVGDFAAWARTPNVKRLSGDFNGDGRMDFALVGGAGWNTIPVAMSRGDGQFTITNSYVGDFGAWAATPGVKALTGDFNRDGHTDIALVGGAGWGALPIAFSTGYGNFNVTNTWIGAFQGWAAMSGARPLVGDFNKDGFADIALVGGAGMTTVPVAFSYGNGSFLVTNYRVEITWWGGGVNFALAAQQANVQAVTGDFNKDGFTDLALTGGAGWSTIRVAMSYGNGAFLLVDAPAASFAGWASSPGVKVLTGDFNKDGFTDLALTGVAGWNTIPVAFSAGGGNFSVTNGFVGAFGSWASTPGARAVTGDFNGDGFTDIALTGGAGWASIPVAMNAGYGNFSVKNELVKRFPIWSAEAAATVVAGPL